MDQQGPLYPQERTFSAWESMSAKCQQETLPKQRRVAFTSYRIASYLPDINTKNWEK
jgi:hypothetical protein